MIINIADQPLNRFSLFIY